MDITILMTTWLPDNRDGERRFEFAIRAMSSWEKNFEHSENIFLHIADDGSKNDRFEDLLVYAGDIFGKEKISWSTQERRGVGASLNLGINSHIWAGRLIFHAVDDWLLFDRLDLTSWADILESDENICGFRFFPHPDLTGRIKYINPGVYAMDLDKHHFAFATRPSLWHPRMFETYGMFEEGVSAYEVERLYNEKYCLIVGPKLWLALPDQWAHLGGVELGDITP